MNTNWPELNYFELKDTLATVQLWTQIVGKNRLRKMPWLNHSWHVTLYVSARGLTTGSMPYDDGVFQLDFDFINHQLLIQSSNNGTEKIDLYARTVASFYTELMEKLAQMKIEVIINTIPNELEEVIPFEQDEVHTHYEAEQIYLFWQALVKIEPIFTRFRAKFHGKCSPVHFFWGAFDLAVTRFSGRKAPEHTGAAPHMPARVMKEAYSHEVSSSGFWAGSDNLPHAAFYAYCYPTPEAYPNQQISPAEAYFDQDLGEYILKYDDVRNAEDPEAFLLDFLQSTYDVAANTADWNREALDCDYSAFENSGEDV